MADSFARQGESEARADGRPMVETRTERTTKLLPKKAQPVRPIPLQSFRIRRAAGKTPVSHPRGGRGPVVKGFGGKVAGSKGGCAGSWMGRPVASMSVGATSQIKVYEAMLEGAIRADAVTFLSTQAQSQIIDPAVPPTRRSRWSGN